MTTPVTATVLASGPAVSGRPNGGGTDPPEVLLLDALASDLDADALRGWARRLSAASGAPFSTRSYRYPYALVSWHHCPVGADIERVGRCDAALADLVCTPDERPRAARSTDPDHYLTSLWSAKEALSKALGNAVWYEPSRLGSPVDWPLGKAGPWRAAQLDVPAGHVAWLCWSTAASAAHRLA